MMATEKATVTSTDARPRRQSIGKRNRLSVKDQDPNYVYRIVNVVDDRVEQFIEQGYEIAPAAVGDKRVDNGTPLGSQKQISVGNETKAIVMRQRKDYYAEDQAAKQASIDALEATMNQTAKKGF
jgi:hypothetical protein